MSGCRQTFSQSLFLQFSSDSHETCHMFYVPIWTELEQIFEILILNFWANCLNFTFALSLAQHQWSSLCLSSLAPLSPLWPTVSGDDGLTVWDVSVCQPDGQQLLKLFLLRQVVSMKLGMNDVRARGYIVIEWILNVCIIRSNEPPKQRSYFSKEAVVLTQGIFLSTDR